VQVHLAGGTARLGDDWVGTTEDGPGPQPDTLLSPARAHLLAGGDEYAASDTTGFTPSGTDRDPFSSLTAGEMRGPLGE
jgi:hypothetical protein